MTTIFYEVNPANETLVRTLKSVTKDPVTKLTSNGNEELQLICNCGKVYRNEASFRFHKYECGKSFECPFCNYVGKRNTTLRKHIKARHDRLYSPRVESL